MAQIFKPRDAKLQAWVGIFQAQYHAYIIDNRSKFFENLSKFRGTMSGLGLHGPKLDLGFY